MESAESDCMEGPTPAQLAAFGSALDDAMRAADKAPAAVAAHVGLTDDAIRKWMKGSSEPPPWRIFAAEQFLGLAPGELSRHLGFVPVDVVSVQAAIDADQALTEAARRIVHAAYKAARG